MNPLEQKIIEKIKEQGPITFETFMDMALYYPELGYYASIENVIGRKGDYYTSPHLHRIFGAMIGKQLEEMWVTLGRPPDFHAVEIGAGAGYLCKDILDYLKNREIFNSLNYIIVELNPVMAASQKKLLSNFSNKVRWISFLGELNTVKGCVFSNELLDAFPVHLVKMDDKNYPSAIPLPQGEGVRGCQTRLIRRGEKDVFSEELKEVYIAYDNNFFIEQYQTVNSNDLTYYFRQFSLNIPHGYRTEINLRIRGWLKEIFEVLSEGFILTIDYGYTAREYYNEERTRGTLLCYHKHRLNENPYENIGKQDITAHVNFSSLKTWGEETGLKTLGYCPQGTFLIALGIDEVITELCSDSPDYQSEILKIKGLLLPPGMGESHRVMIQYKGKGAPELRGFSLRNQAGNL